MTRYVFRRLGGAIIILWVIITVTFALMHAIPGGPFTTEKKLPPQVKQVLKQSIILMILCGSSMVII